MEHCSDILTISALACKIADCLSDEELEIFAADIVMLGDTLEAILARRSIC